MSTPGRDEQHGDLAASGLARVAADDLLLDALGRGEAPEGDPAVAMLAAWRADLSSDLAEPEPASPVVPASPGVPVRDRRRQRLLTRMVLGAAAAAVVAVGLAVSAHQAEPGSPLWPVSKVVYPQRSEVVAAEKAIADARTASAAGRDGDARDLLAVASRHIARIDDRAVAERLRADVDTILRGLAGAAPAAPGTPATPATPAPSAQTSGPAATSPPQDGGGAPTPQPSQPGLLPDLPLPTPLLPTPLLPLPPLPSLLPG